MIMSKQEVKNSIRWAANAEAPIDRDTQIALMLSAKQRHKERVARLQMLLQGEKDNGID